MEQREANAMKYFWSRLVPVLLPACMVDTPVVEGDQNDDDERLGAGLAAWCESLCARVAECEPEDYQATCPATCADYYSETFVGKTDACTEAALRLMDCREQNSCAEIRSGVACNQADEEDRCYGSVGLAVCREDSSGGGTAGFGGSGGPPPLESCETGLDDCSDDHEYTVACRGLGVMPVCDCLYDTEVTGRFYPSASVCPDPSIAKQICAWPVAARRGEPELPPVVRCFDRESYGTAPPGNEAECGAEFGDCSDGHTYAVECGGSPGAVECTCYVDSEAVGYYESPVGICNSVHDNDLGNIATNFACGFRIAPITEH
jgi:hypothetical protein